MTSLSQAMCGAFDVAGEHEEGIPFERSKPP